MSDDRNIDRLFQESFKDFEVSAPKNSWRNIEKRLSQQRHKTIFPLWQKLSGAAVVIGILILVGSQWLINPTKIDSNNSVVDAPQNNTENNLPNDSNSNIEILSTTQIEDNQINYNASTEKQNQSNNNAVATSETSDINTNAQHISNNASDESNLNLTSASTGNINQINNNQTNKKYLQKENNVAFLKNLNSKNVIQQMSQVIQASLIENNNFNNAVPEKKSLIEVAQNINDDLPDKPKITGKSWFIKPQISPVFYGNLGSGSAVDSNLSENSSQGEINMTYGVNVAYKLNDKIKLRTGVNRVNLNYTTNDVFLVQSGGLSSLNNVNANPNFNASVLSNKQIENLSTNGIFNRAEAFQSELKQELGFIEIPMEIEYKIIDQKISINLIGGASTFLLNNNNLDIQNLNGTTSVGEANNLNNLSFSTNFAIGLDYDISKRFMLNLEPTFKYQFNTFQNGTTDFQPYFLGIYSGIVFKF